MKKVLKIGTLNTLLGPTSVVLAYRKGDTISIQNLEASANIKFEKTKDELVIRVAMKDNDFLALDEEPGVAAKVDV